MVNKNVEAQEKPAHTARFVRVVSEVDFLESDPSKPVEENGIERFKFEARRIIDQVDPNICDFMRSFKLNAEPNGNIELSQQTRDKLDGTPEQFLIALLRYIDFSDVTPDIAERNIQTLAGFVASRFTAISLVAHSKKLNGEISSLHPQRHEAVLGDRAKDMALSGHDSRLCRKIFGEFMQAGCDIQDGYINDQDKHQVEPNHPVAHKLRALGITPN